MRPGAVFVTVLCPLVSHKFDVIEEAEMAFSWGAVECLVHRRKTDADADDARALEEACAPTPSDDTSRTRRHGADGVRR